MALNLQNVRAKEKTPLSHGGPSRQSILQLYELDYLETFSLESEDTSKF